MAYQSLYRKWRPQTFAAMVGQEHVGRTLANAVRDGRMAHAYLLTGPRGTGKTSAARLFAKALNCPQRQGAEPCDACPSCIAIREGRSLDVLEIDGASNRGIDEIRDLRERVGMAATLGQFRFYIIDEVHQLTEAAFNALLKTLEEPPAHVVFILATTDAHKVPATISSRCQHFSFHRHSPAGIAARLREVAEVEGFTLEPAALEQLVRAADGSLRDALSVLDQAVAFGGETVTADGLAQMLGLVPAAAVEEFAATLRERDIAASVRLPGRLADEGADLRQFNRQVLDHLRGVLGEQSATAHRPAGDDTARWDLPHLLATIRAFAAIDFSARLNVIPQLPLELAAVESCTYAAPTPALGGATSVEPRPAAAPRPTLRPAPAEPPAARTNHPTPRSAATSELATADPGEAEDSVLQTPAAAVPAFARPATAAPGVPDEQRRRWERVLSLLRPRSSKVQGLCNSCEFLGLDGRAMVLSARGNKFVMDSINEPKARAIVEPVLTEVFGQELTLRCELQGTPPAPQDGAAPVRDLISEARNNPTVRMAMDAFGARIDSVLPLEEGRAAG